MTTLVLVGGFLGAGKTRLLLRAAAMLRERGKSVGLILNDQGGELVDTALAGASGFTAAGVTGGCFCCRFSDFLATADRLPAVDVLLAEPVGSCTDLSATILQPLKSCYAGRFRLAPFTVLVDAAHARDALAPGVDSDLAWLFRKQLEEADLVVYGKSDLYPEVPDASARRLSAATGEGVAAWLDEVLGGGIMAGARLLEIDYARYARAEASLGWLNCEAGVLASRPLTPAAIAGPLLQSLDAAVPSIAHLKVFVGSGAGYIKASICRNGEEPGVEGMPDAPPSGRHRLVLNLRASAAPDLLREAVCRALASVPGKVTVLHLEAFRPAPPQPEHRFDRAVEPSAT